MQSTPKPSTWIEALWQDLADDNLAVLPACYIPLLETGFDSLPVFLREFCELYYKQQMPLHEVALTLQMKDHLAKQRWEVSVSLFRILLASKPKNPV